MVPHTFTRRLRDGRTHYVTVGDYELTCTFPNADSNRTPCRRVFTKVHLMRNHLIECHAEGIVQRPYICDICNKGFKAIKQLGQCKCKKNADQSQPQAGPSHGISYSDTTEEQLEILKGVVESLNRLEEYPGESTVQRAVVTIQKANTLLGGETGSSTLDQLLAPTATSSQWVLAQDSSGPANATELPPPPPPPPPQGQYIGILPSNMPAPPEPLASIHSPTTDPRILDHTLPDEAMSHTSWARTPAHPRSPTNLLPTYDFRYPPINANTAGEEGSGGFDHFSGLSTGGERNANMHPPPPM